MCTKVLLLLPLILCYFAVASGIPLGGVCTHSSNCTSTTSDSECKSLTCQCTGTHFQQNNMCFSKIALGSPCNGTTPCDDENASCMNTCTCNTAFYPDTTCKPRIHPNMTCGNSTPKNVSCVANAYCDSTNICLWYWIHGNYNILKTSNSTQVGTDNNLESPMHACNSDHHHGSIPESQVIFSAIPYVCGEVEVISTEKFVTTEYLPGQRYVSKLNYPTRKLTKEHDYSYHRDDKVLVDSSTQTEVTANDIRLLEQENDRLKHTLEDKESLSREIFVKHVTKDDKHVKFYTGVQNFAILMGIFQLLITKCSKLKYWSGKGSVNDKNYQTGNKLKPGPQRKLTDFQEFILTLVRLRLGLIDYHLADIFGISKTRVSQIFTTWITFMSGLFGKLIKWPSKQQVRKHMPHSFKMLYPKTRCIIDCTEFFFQHPRSPTAQASTYSTYKSKNTGKCLLGISPSGTFTFVSDVYGGNVSDRFITEKSGFMDYIEEGDDIMADRGFTIRDLLTEKKATLNMPPFTRKCVWGKKKRLNVNEIKQTRSIAKLRIHVERAIQRLKLFKLIGNTIAWSLKPLTNQMVKVSAFLCNLMPKLVRR